MSIRAHILAVFMSRERNPRILSNLLGKVVLTLYQRDSVLGRNILPYTQVRTQQQKENNKYFWFSPIYLKFMSFLSRISIFTCKSSISLGENSPLQSTRPLSSIRGHFLLPHLDHILCHHFLFHFSWWGALGEKWEEKHVGLWCQIPESELHGNNAKIWIMHYRSQDAVLIAKF